MSCQTHPDTPLLTPRDRLRTSVAVQGCSPVEEKTCLPRRGSAANMARNWLERGISKSRAALFLEAGRSQMPLSWFTSDHVMQRTSSLLAAVKNRVRTNEALGSGKSLTACQIARIS